MNCPMKVPKWNPGPQQEQVLLSAKLSFQPVKSLIFHIAWILFRKPCEEKGLCHSWVDSCLSRANCYKIIPTNHRLMLPGGQIHPWIQLCEPTFCVLGVFVVFWSLFNSIYYYFFDNWEACFFADISKVVLTVSPSNTSCIFFLIFSG